MATGLFLCHRGPAESLLLRREGEREDGRERKEEEKRVRKGWSEERESKADLK